MNSSQKILFGDKCKPMERGEDLGKINQGSNHRDDLGDDPDLWTEGDQRNCFGLNWVEMSNTKVVSCRDLYFPPLFSRHSSF